MRVLTAPGQEIRFVETGRDTGGARLTTEWTVTGWDGPLPHRHAAMRESWEVLEGVMTVVVDGVDHVMRPGDGVITAEPGMLHTFRKSADGPLSWRQVNEPVLHHEVLFVLDHRRALAGGGPTAKPGPILTIRELAAADAVFEGRPVLLQLLLRPIGHLLNRRLAAALR